LVGKNPAQAPVVPAPSIPQPDYRTKPDYKVKISDTVEIVPNEVVEYSDTENEVNRNTDQNEGDERL
jgi:hypothetical protein